MEYESVILKRLIDTYGVVGNPRYISEIIKEFIVQGKERFPELFTYQADWLAHIDEFGLNPSYTVSYTGQSIYAPNTLEKPVKSAILNGQTLLMDEVGNECEIPNTPKVKLGVRIDLDTGKDVESAPSFITGFLKCPSVTFVIKGNNRYKKIAFYKNDKTFISSIDTKVSTNSPITIDSSKIPSNAFYLRFSASINGDGASYTPDTKLLIEDVSGNNLYRTQLISVKMPVLTTSNEDGTKTNILTVNEPVELRGIGDVKDELDCLTGELTQRIGEIVLDGSENWVRETKGSNVTSRFSLEVNDMLYENINTTNKNNLNVSGGFPVLFNGTPDQEQIFSHYGRINIRINDSKLNVANDVDSFKAYLQSNPITVQYKLATPTIKTVDLTILDQNGQNVKQLMSFNGGTHFNTGSLEGSPLPSVSVCVETDLEETLRVCSLDGNTM